jgi:small-conductance mechanosensitive channel
LPSTTVKYDQVYGSAMDNDYGRRVLMQVAIVVAALMVAVISYYLFDNYYAHILGPNLSRFVYAAIVSLFIYAAVRVVVAGVERFLLRFMDVSRAHPFVFLVSLVGYVILALAVLWAIGINVTSVVLGGTFLSLIIGLAAQSVLANMFAGLMIIVSRPFRVGQQVGILAWQYGIALPSYPPKFFSKDEIRPSYNGKVVSVSINYTTIEEESGNLVRIANSVLLQASVTIRGKYQMVRARYEIPKSLQFSTISREIAGRVAEIKGCQEAPVVTIDETAINTYVISILGKFETKSTDVTRSEILRRVMDYVEPLKGKTN